MSQRRKVERIKDASERTIEGLVTKKDEFVYEYTGGRVPKDKIYSTFFTSDKSEIYMTGIMTSNNNKIILKINDNSIINKYRKTKITTRQDYPETQAVSPDNTDYDIGSVVRYFAQKANDSKSKFFEISLEDYSKQNALFSYYTFNWIITGRKDEVERENKKTLATLPNSLQKLLFPLQLWRPTKNSRDDVEKKLERLVR